jgi:putrescine transport system ATP-binding protein
LPSSGRIELDGQDLSGLPPYRRPVNMMFQSYALFPHMTVAENIAFGLRQDGLPKAQRERRVEEMLALVKMESMARRKPHQLSGGQQQRVALARSLAKRPKLLLLDEPMGALDKKLRSEMQLEVVNIIEQIGVTCVMVTHDQEEAMTMAHRIAIMDEGRIVQVGTPDEIYEQPANRFAATFVGSVNLVEGKIEEDAPDHITIRASGLPEPIYIGHGHTGYEDMEVIFALRPEKLVISKEMPDQPHNRFRGKIEEIAYFGSHSVMHIRLPSGLKLLAHVPNSRRWANEDFTWEDEVWASWDEMAGVVLSS